MTAAWARAGLMAAVLFWGLSFVAIKVVVAEIGPWTLAFVRTGLGAALLMLLPLVIVKGRQALPPRATWGPLALMGFVGITLHQLLQAYALTLTSATNAGWLAGLAPVWTACLAAMILHERLGPSKLLGFATAFVGATLVVTHGQLEAEVLKLPSTRGDLLMLASTVNWAVYSVIGHATIRRLGALRATAGAAFCGWLLLLPVFVLTGGWRELHLLTVRGWGALLFLGGACSGLAYLFWYGGLARLETSKVAAFLHLEPLVAVAAALLVLGERVPLSSWLGGGLVLLGVALVQRSPAAPAPEVPGSGRR